MSKTVPKFLIHPDLMEQCIALGWNMSGFESSPRVPPFEDLMLAATSEGVRKVLESIGAGSGG